MRRPAVLSTRSGLPFIVSSAELRGGLAERQLAHALHDDYGVRKGDRVAISLRNYPEWMIAFCAATSIGAIAVGMNALWQPHEMEYALNHCGARAVPTRNDSIGCEPAARCPPGWVVRAPPGRAPARATSTVLRAHAGRPHAPGRHARMTTRSCSTPRARLAIQRARSRPTATS
jgi:hypothetical protein